MSFRIKKPSFLQRKKNFKEKEKEKGKKKNDFADSEDKFDAITDKQIVSMPKLARASTFTITHEVEGKMIETSCPSIIFADKLLIDEEKCESKIISPDSKTPKIKSDISVPIPPSSPTPAKKSQKGTNPFDDFTDEAKSDSKENADYIIEEELDSDEMEGE